MALDADAGRRWLSVSRSVMWWIGDWLRFGDGKWGETSAQAVSMTGRQEQTLLDAQWVARKFVDNSRRREELSWSHHKEVAALPPTEADELLDLVEREGLSKRELRAEVSRRKAARVIGAAMPSALTVMPSARTGAFCQHNAIGQSVRRHTFCRRQ